MRSFQRSETFDPVPGDVVTLLRRIDLAAGGEGRYSDQLPELLSGLAEEARVLSITASSAIEGVSVVPSRAPGLISGSTRRFRSRSEAEFAGYRAALDYVCQGDSGPLTVGLVLHLHRLLLSFTDAGGGRFKLDDNVVIERGADGRREIRFTPVPAKETEYFVSELVERTSNALDEGRTHPLLVVAAFALDFLCIHPFADGNGRVARLATTLLLDNIGYGVGRYVSIEQLIFDTKGEYYEALAASTAGWFDDGSHELWPWARYLLARLAAAYQRFDARVAVGPSRGTKQDRVRDHVLLRGSAVFRISDVRRALPGISDNTIRLVLAELKREGLIDNDGTGRSAAWHRTTR